MTRLAEWEDWFERELRHAGIRWQDQPADDQDFSAYDRHCEQLLKTAERRWRLKYSEPPSYGTLMRALSNAQYRIDRRPWDGFLIRVRKVARRLRQAWSGSDDRQ